MKERTRTRTYPDQDVEIVAQIDAGELLYECHRGVRSFQTFLAIRLAARPSQAVVQPDHRAVRQVHRHDDKRIDVVEIGPREIV